MQAKLKRTTCLSNIKKGYMPASCFQTNNGISLSGVSLAHMKNISIGYLVFVYFRLIVVLVK